MGFGRQTMVEDVFADAADAVATHFRFRAVGVENAHCEVGDF